MPQAQVNLKRWVDKTKDLPEKLSYYLKMLQDTDEKCHKLQQDLDKVCKRKLLHAASQGGKAPVSSPAGKRRRISHSHVDDEDEESDHDEDDEERLERNMDQMLALCEEKFKVVSDMYNMIDSNIQEMDRNLQEMEARMNDEYDTVGVKENSNAREALNEWHKTGRLPLDKGVRRGGRRKGDVAEAVELPVPDISLEEPPVNVDPSEPRYCLCNNVSYGRMIGCENEQCPIEWFHFRCVGLEEEPKGKWWCPQCAASQKTVKTVPLTNKGAGGGRGRGRGRGKH